jgi:hypothetical protein
MNKILNHELKPHMLRSEKGKMIYELIDLTLERYFKSFNHLAI